ncbi:MAG TPA: hypothetical protein VK638_29320 [Edaphobacter sp.]|nr:hypothetical protein [Edaphobacter sp.]
MHHIPTYDKQQFRAPVDALLQFKVLLLFFELEFGKTNLLPRCVRLGNRGFRLPIGGESLPCRRRGRFAGS